MSACGMGGEAHVNPGLAIHCGFILLAYAQASLTERLLAQLGLSSVNWLPDPHRCSVSSSSEDAIMSSQNAVC